MSCNEWQKVKLGDLIESISVKHSFNKNKLIFLNTSDILEGKVLHNNYSDIEGLPGQAKKSIKKDDILFSEIRPKNKRFAYVDFDSDDYVVSTKLMVLRKKSNNINNRYLYYYLTSDKTLNYLQTIAEGRSGTFPQITFNELKIIEIDLPPLEEQEKIANILSSLDDKIELNNEMNKTLEEMAQSLFKRWFVDFEFPNEDGEPYKSSGGEMVDSELGMIPNGWEVVNYINTSDIQYGFAFKSKLFNDKEGKPIIRIRDISNSYTPTYTTEEYNDLYIVTKNDILVGMDGEFKAHIWGGKDSLLNQRVLRIRPKDNNSIAYSYFSIKEPLRYLENSKVGTTVIHLGKKDIDNIKIVYPPNNLISKYRDIADNLINKICENKVEIMELLELRDSLLPKLMSGEIKVN
nr:restriction endonuclease subunit S [uncultured Romboutsia sp.]